MKLTGPEFVHCMNPRVAARLQEVRNELTDGTRVILAAVCSVTGAALVVLVGPDGDLCPLIIDEDYDGVTH